MSEIPEFLDQEPIPGSAGEMSLVETWIAAFTKPNEGTFAEIAAQSRANSTNAFLWVFVASLITSFATLIAQSVGVGSMGGFRELLPPELARELPMGGGGSAIGFGTVICGTPVAAIVAVFVFAISVGLMQWVAKMFGGTGSFDKLAYTFSAITVPYSVIAAVLTLFGMIPYVGILTGLVSFGLSIYILVLEVLAVKAVNNLDTGKAIGAVFLPGFVIALFVCCCAAIVVGGLASLGPSINDVFNEINQSLY